MHKHPNHRSITSLGRASTEHAPKPVNCGVRAVRALRATAFAFIGLAGLAGVGQAVAQSGDSPTVTIAAERSEYGLGIDVVSFTLTRGGSVESALTVPVTLTQDDGYLAASELDRSVTFEANASSAKLEIPPSEFLATATQTGNLTASVVEGERFDVGTPSSATVRMLVADPAMTVRIKESSYRFAEGQTGTNVGVLARTAAGLPRPNGTFVVSVSTGAIPESAISPDDFAPVSVTVEFASGDFRLDGDAWQARKEVALSIVDDDIDESHETLNVKLERLPGLPRRVVLAEAADGLTDCGNLCEVPVTIEDDDDGKPSASAPRTLTLTPSHDAVTLGWTAPSADGGNAVTKYQYRVSADGGTTWDPDWTDIADSAPGEANSTAYEVTDLDAETAYRFELRAVNAIGAGAAVAGTITTSPVTATTPTAPRTVILAPSHDSVALGWAAPADDGGSEVTKYQYRVSADGGTTWDPDWTDIADSAPGGVNSTAYEVTGLDAETAYRFELRAVSAIGEGAAAAGTATTSAASATTPSAPTGLVFTPSHDAVALDWAAPADDGGSAVTKYQYRVSADGGTTWDPDWTDIADSAPGGANAISYEVTGLAPETEYSFELRAVNVNGEGAEVAGRTTTTATRTPSAPRALTLTPSHDAVALGWEAPADDGGSAVTKYQYRVSADGGTTWDPDWTDIADSAPGEANATSYEVTGLAPETEYSFELRAVNAAGEGAEAADTATTTATPSAPSAPRNLKLTPGDGAVTLEWEAPADDGGSAVTKYQYRVSADGGTTWDPDWTDIADSAPGQTNAASYEVSSLANGTQYLFELRAKTDAGPGAPAADTATPVGTTTVARVEFLSPAKTYAIGDTIRVKVSFSGDVEVVASETARPYIDIDVGGSQMRAYFSSLDGSDSLLFDYTVQRGDVDNDGISIGADALAVQDGSSIRTAGGPVPLDHAEVGPDPTRKVDGVPPAVESATVDGRRVVLRYGEALDERYVPAAPGGFAVTVEDASRTVDWLSVNGAEVTLILAAAVENGQTVTLSYAVPDPGQDGNSAWTDAIRDIAGNEAESFADHAVTNATAVLPRISVADAEAMEEAQLFFRVTLDRPAPAPVTVDWETADETAEAGVDYEAGRDTLSFATGETEKTVEVVLIDDLEDEGTETLTFTLSNPRGRGSRSAGRPEGLRTPT